MCKLLLFVSWRLFYRSAITLIHWSCDGVSHVRLNSLHADVLDSTCSIQLQLSGEIVRGTMVSAVLTDQNIPIQPDGTTKDIEDLDIEIQQQI